MRDKDSLDGRGMIVPATQPDDFICARIYIPDDQLYIAAFWGWLERLTAWNVWERGGTKAKEAATKWKEAWALSRTAWDGCAGECGIVDVRQKPADPCVLQKRECCDGDWETFADLELCKYEPPAPYQEYPGDELNDILWSWNQTIIQIDAWLDAGKSSTEIKLLMSALIAQYPGLAAVIDDMEDTPEVDRQAAIDGMDWQEMRDTVWCDDVCDKQSEGAYQDILNWVQCVVLSALDWLSGEADKMSGWVGGMMDGVSAWSGITELANMFPDGGEGFGFDPTVCYFEHIWNAANGWAGWAASGVDTGELSGGVWYSEYVDLYTQLVVDSGLAEEVTITEVEIHYSTTEHPFGQHRVRYWNGEAWADLFAYPYTTGSHEEPWSGTQEVQRLKFDWESYGDEYPATLSYLRVRGIGMVDPWE